MKYKIFDRVEISKEGILNSIRQTKGTSQTGTITSLLSGAHLVMVLFDGTKHPIRISKCYITKHTNNRKIKGLKTYTRDEAKRKNFMQITDRQPGIMLWWCESEVKRIRQDPGRKAIVVKIEDQTGRKEYEVWASKVKLKSYIERKKDCKYIMKNKPSNSQ